MNLVLEIVKHPNIDILQKTMTFNERGGKIGRSKSAKWVLNDPSKHISNFHADISYKSGKYYITDISSNGTYLKTPYKKLIKGRPVLLTQGSIFIIGDYDISVKALDDTFVSSKPPKASAAKLEGSSPVIPDDFFLGNENQETFGLLQDETPEGHDVVSLLTGENKPINIAHNEELLPDIETLLNPPENQFESIEENPLSAHIVPPAFENPEQEKENEPIDKTQPNESEKLFELILLKLGIDANNLSGKKKLEIASEIADITRISIESVQQLATATSNIKKQLGAYSEHSTQDPIFTQRSLKDIFTMKHPRQPSYYLKGHFHDISVHHTALFGTLKDINSIYKERFSPEKLYYKFEKDDKLSKSFTNKKAQAWEAYCEKFSYLDDDNTEDLNEIGKAYVSILETIDPKS